MKENKNNTKNLFVAAKIICFGIVPYGVEQLKLFLDNKTKESK